MVLGSWLQRYSHLYKCLYNNRNFFRGERTDILQRLKGKKERRKIYIRLQVEVRKKEKIPRKVAKETIETEKYFE